MNRFACAVSPLFVLLTAVSSLAGEHAELFSRLDADHDGRLIAAEVPKDQLTIFKRLVRMADRNDDGLLTAGEFESGLAPTTPEKPLTVKVENEVPGSDALLLVLAWMDLNADLVIATEEVTAEMRPLFDEFVGVLNVKNKSRIRIPQLSQQAIQFAGRASRFAVREGIDVEVEMALLSDAQLAYIERLQTSLGRREGMFKSPEGAAVIFGELDTDGDGNVTAAEVPQALSERFARMLSLADRDQDKQLSEQEFKDVTTRMARLEANRSSLAKSTQRVGQLIGRSDRDSNGRLSREEAPPRMARNFARLDQNGDGELDQRELARGVEILAALRNSAETSPPTTPQKRRRPKNPAEK